MNDIPPDEALEELDISELIDAHLEAQTADEFADDVPTVVETRTICPGCGGDQFRLEETDQPPSNHGQAWRKGPLVAGKPLWAEGACRGNTTWDWCPHHTEHDHKGTLTIRPVNGEGGMDVHFFPDRRLEVRPVEVERRKR